MGTLTTVAKEVGVKARPWHEWRWLKGIWNHGYHGNKEERDEIECSERLGQRHSWALSCQPCKPTWNSFPRWDWDGPTMTWSEFTERKRRRSGCVNRSLSNVCWRGSSRTLLSLAENRISPVYVLAHRSLSTYAGIHTAACQHYSCYREDGVCESGSSGCQQQRRQGGVLNK